jgi:large subunit ribosomal protein L21
MPAKTSENTGYAVIATGGKQYMVREGDKVTVELLDVEPGEKVEITAVLAVSDGKTLKVGTPEIEGAKVVCTAIEHNKADKVISFKKKRRKGFKKKIGHRQNHTVLSVEKL